MNTHTYTHKQTHTHTNKHTHTHTHTHTCTNFPDTAQLNLNLTFTHVWHASFWTNFSCHSQITREKIIKIYIYTQVTLESLDKFIGSLASCTWSEQIFWATCELHVSVRSDALVKYTLLTRNIHIMLRVKCTRGYGTSGWECNLIQYLY